MRNQLQCIAISGMFALLLSCSTNPLHETTSATNKHTVSGKLHSNGRPVANAKVSIAGFPKLTTISGDSGNFSLDSVPEGNQTLQIQKAYDDSSSTTLNQVILVFKNLDLSALLLPIPIRLHDATTISANSIKLHWGASAASDFREYKLFRHYTSGLDENTGDLVHVTTSVTDTTFIDSLPTSNTTCYYRIYVMNQYGKIGGSNIISGRTGDPFTPSPHILNWVKNIGVPLSNPVGIASDSENLWLMFGAYNGLEHHLVYYSPTNYTVLKTFTFSNLTEQPGTGVYGITCDDTTVWISVSGNTNKVVKVSPENGSIVRTWSSPTELGPPDLDWDGNKLWISTGTGQLYTMDSQTGSSQLFLKLPFERDLGIAVRANELWVGDLFSNDIHTLSTVDGSYLGRIKNALRNSGSFCFFKGQLVVLSNAGIDFYDVQLHYDNRMTDMLLLSS